jgi:hypothetical protein
VPIEWSPAAHARPTEWLLRVTESQPPYAVVRRFLKGDPNRPEEWFRVVTWAPTSEARELVGWVRTFDAACALGWDHKCAFESWRHHMAARRVDATAMEKRKPTAAELVKFWREQNRLSPTRNSGP